MKFGMRLSLLLALFMTACSSVVPELSPASDIAVVDQVPSETPALLSTATAVPSPTAPALAFGTASFRGVRFQYDLSFVSAVRGEIIPVTQGSTPDLDIPEHIGFIFDNIAISRQFNPLEPQLLIFPIDDFREISSRRAETAFDILTELLQERPLPLTQELTLMPPAVGKPAMQTHVKYLQFANGEGVRFLTSYSEDIGPVTNETLFYTFQGISTDREYFISLFFPIETQLLPDTFETSAAAADYWLFVANYDSYLAETIEQLENISAAGFTPKIGMLDNMIESLYLPDAIKLQQVSDPEKITDRIRREGKSALHALWRDLNLTSILFEAPGQLNLELFDLKVDGNRDEFRLLLISDTAELDWQYLLFRSVGNRWLFVGNVDLPDQKFLPPVCRIVERNGTAWWVLTWLEHSEIGTTHYRETWYRFNEDELRLVLDFPLEGYQISTDFAYNVSYRGDLVAEEDDRTNAFRLTYNISYSIFGDGENRAALNETYNLFDVNRSVVYVWDDQEHRFVLDPVVSQLTQEQIDSAFYFPGPELTFLQFAASELSLIARNGTALQKRWLVQYLENLEASPEVENFKILIGG
jgi:hypothetical protein